jgi:hypothetical protein
MLPVTPHWRFTVASGWCFWKIADGFLQERLRIAHEAQTDVAVFSGWRADSAGNHLVTVYSKQPYGQTLTGQEWIRHYVIQREWHHYLWLSLTRSVYICEHGLRFQEGKIHKDILWTIHLAAGNGRFYFADRKDYTYISNLASITHCQDYYDIHAASYIDVITDILSLSEQ